MNIQKTIRSKMMNLKRFKIRRDCGGYGQKGMFIILDRFKLATCIRDKRYTKTAFETLELAQGYLYGRGLL
tara:strand:+ start:370 stop:582 length:213 start_codon:yes stop_codon:yes gene_type:complete